MSGDTGERLPLRAGEKVRLKSDPSWAGILTGEIKELRGRIRWEVRLLSGAGVEYVPALALEVVQDTPDSPCELLKRGQLSRVGVLRRALTHHRLNGRLADLIYSLNTTNTDFYAWQFKPVLSFLESSNGGVLIADEVGLGKTIEAGLIWTELRSREDARRLLVLCPAMLREKWRRELAEKFGVEAEIASAGELLRRLKNVNRDPATSFALICSLQGLRPPAGWREDDREDRLPSAALSHFLLDHAMDEPLLDLLIIDEAHYLRNPETQTARLGRLMRPLARGLVLLSATPVQMRSADLFHLLNLIDESTFEHPWSFEEIVRENAPLVALRDRLIQGPIYADDFIQSLRDVINVRTLSRSATLENLVSEPPSSKALSDPSTRAALAEKLDRANPLSRVICRSRKRDVYERRVRRRVYAIKCPLSEAEARLYRDVTERVRAYCAGLGVGEGFLLTIPQRQLCSSMPAAVRAWQRRMEDVELEEILQEVLADLEALNPNDHLGQRRTVQPLIFELAKIAQDIGDYQVLKAQDSKFHQLVSQLLDYWERYPDGKIVIFAYFKDTLRYLHERLEELGVSSALLYGGMDKDAILDNFRDERGPRVLLSSEVASEGVDLQFSSVVVNYDLPWNPMRVEQRIGRIDRLGQKAEAVLIWNFFYEGTLDDRVYSRLFERLNVFEQALGSTEAVIGESMRKMSYDLLRHHLTPEEEAEIVEGARIVVEQNARLEDKLESDASTLVGHGAYLQMKISTARDLHRYVTGEDLFSYVTDFFAQAYPSSQFVIEDRLSLVAMIDLSADARRDLTQFIERQRSRGQTRLGRPAAGRIRCRFDNQMANLSDDAETISQVHPLVSFVTHAQRLKSTEMGVLPTAAMIDSDHVPRTEKGTYVFVVQRWFFSGQRDVEKLVFSASLLGPASKVLSEEAAERLVTSAAMSGAEWLNATGEIVGVAAHTAVQDLIRDMDGRFRTFISDMNLENEDRFNLQVEVLERHREGKTLQLQDRIDRMKSEDKSRAVRMFSAQLSKHLGRCEEKRLELHGKRETSHDAQLIALGVVRVF